MLGHCTGRLLTGRGRPESEFDEEFIIAACLDARHRARGELPSRTARSAQAHSRTAHELGVKIAISTDAHATDQLEWQAYGTDRAAECGYDREQGRQRDERRRPAGLDAELNPTSVTVPWSASPQR